MFKRWIKLVILCFSLVFMHGTALATVAVHSSFPVSVRVYTNTPAVNFQQKLDVLVVFDIQKPWHILSPKNVDIGLPTKISWSLPEGYVLSSESWSFEQVFPSEFGPQYGFSDKAFYRAEIIPEGNQRLKADFALDVSWQACAEECLQKNVSLPFSLPISEENVFPSSEWRLISSQAQPYFEKPLPLASSSTFSLWKILLMAFIGGLILNLMPCVLPILSLKIISLVQSTTDMLRAKFEALAYFFGVMLSFVGMAFILFLLRKSGEYIGWGFQLQSSWFVGILLIIFLFLTLMFLDVISINFTFLSKTNRYIPQKGYWGAFFTGFFSVLVASSCSAPFMGAAIGYTLMQPLSISLAVFLALGIGYALPFTLAGFFPSTLASLLPRPGKWMVTLKKILAIPMALTCLWLGWILYAQLSSSVFAHRHWLVYDEAQIKTALDQKEKVFIDFSAKWCLTCLANEKLVLDTQDFIDYAQQNNIKLFRADWTTKNPQITKALEAFGRNSVPLYVFYNQGEPAVLPQIFTFNQLISYLEQK